MGPVLLLRDKWAEVCVGCRVPIDRIKSSAASDWSDRKIARVGMSQLVVTRGDKVCGKGGIIGEIKPLLALTVFVLV